MPGRNEPCACNSGAKYKKCCGAPRSSLQMSLYQKAAENNAAAVQRAIAAGVEINDRNRDGGTALFIAAQHGHVDVVQCLIDAAADVDREYSHPESGATPLTISAFKGFEDVVRCLLRATAAVNKATYDGVSALHAASGEGHTQIVRTLIKAAAEVNQAESKGGSSPLHVATETGHAPIVRLLIKAGAVESPMFDKGKVEIGLEELTNDQATLTQLAQQRCAMCNKLCRVKWCLSCKLVGYCSVNCQREDWTRHKQCCGKGRSWRAVLWERIHVVKRRVMESGGFVKFVRMIIAAVARLDET